MPNFITPVQLLDMLCENRKIQISITNISYASDSVTLTLPYKYKVHYCKFCDKAKEAAAGFNLCMKCKELSNKKAIHTQKNFDGLCPFGLHNIVKPIVIDGNVRSIIYISNIVSDRSKSISRLKKSAKATGADTDSLLALLDNAEFSENIDSYISISELIDSYIRLLSEKNRITKTKIPSSSLKIEEIIMYTEKNFDKDITLKKLSQMYFLNVKYLGRKFKQKTGYTFNEYLNNIRLSHAARLLSETEKSVLEISLDCGYGTLSHFDNCFKKKYGLTPAAYKSAGV